MKQRWSTILFTVFSLGLMACSNHSGEHSQDQFGASLTLTQVVPVSDVFVNAEQLDGQLIRVTGRVSDLCKHKGCWMQVSDGKNILTVRFKDEAFIIPATSLGRHVDMEGLFMVDKVSNPQGSHAACADGGSHAGGGTCENERAEKIVQQASEVRYSLVSTGLVFS